MEFLSFLLQLVEAAFSIGIDSVLGVFTEIELDLELLRCTRNALLEAFETHVGSSGNWGDRQGEEREEERSLGSVLAKAGGVFTTQLLQL